MGRVRDERSEMSDVPLSSLRRRASDRKKRRKRSQATQKGSSKPGNWIEICGEWSELPPRFSFSDSCQFMNGEACDRLLLRLPSLLVSLLFLPNTLRSGF